MAQTKLLLDSNSYFRLAKEIHPLLFQEFGSERYCLYVLPELQQEYDRAPRLQRLFPWVDEDEFHRNRSKTLTLSRKNKKAIETAQDAMWDTVQTECPGPSRVDARVLAHAYVLGIEAVTDDGDMRILAEIYDVPTICTLDLMKIMLDAEHIEMLDVRRIVMSWAADRDFPGGFNGDYRRLFGERPPV